MIRHGSFFFGPFRFFFVFFIIFLYYLLSLYLSPHLSISIVSFGFALCCCLNHPMLFMWQCFVFTYRNDREGQRFNDFFSFVCTVPFIQSHSFKFTFEYCGVLRINICINKCKIQTKYESRNVCCNKRSCDRMNKRHFQTIQPYNIFRIVCISMWKRAYTRKIQWQKFFWQPRT